MESTFQFFTLLANVCGAKVTSIKEREVPHSKVGSLPRLQTARSREEIQLFQCSAFLSVAGAPHDVDLALRLPATITEQVLPWTARITASTQSK